MNERIRELIAEADRKCSETRGIYDEILAQLIVRECADIADRAEPYKSTDLILKHFGIEEQVTKSNELHTCPYKEEIHGDYETLCDCDEEQTYECAMDI
jgi:hypothetical protein